jgi:ubiquinone/menaquinone biosynthesis C-methylase UbiE
MPRKREWFETWFDSPYYHILYDHRDEKEAETFIKNLKIYLPLHGKERILDLACGAGRFAAFISKYVDEVVGLDLSENSIQQAKRNYPAQNLEFYKHDMRLPFRINYFDYVFNFFTSFGYFKRTTDNLHVLQSIYKGLKPGGTLVLDFMNTAYSIQHLKESETIVKQNIAFNIKREIKDGKILKHIQFEAKEKSYEFTESVQALLPEDFHSLLEQAGFSLTAEFGGYHLEPYDAEKSSRYIVLAEKKDSNLQTK